MTYTDEEIKERLSKYGAVYLPNDVKEDVDDIKGNEFKKERLDDFFKALTSYKDISKQLKKTKLSPSLTVLLYGPPGTGKTSLTRAFSKKYKIPMCVVESDRLVSPLLGDTIKNIRNVVELAADVAKENGNFVLFFDEIDAVGSERSNIHEVGEIKRAVISFLQVIDKINYESIPLAIFGATNHQHQLDSAIWRRFTFHLKFDFPNYELRKEIIESFLEKIENADIGIDDTIYEKLDKEYKQIKEIHENLESKLGKTISEFEDNLLWNEIEKKKKTEGLLKLTRGYSGSDIERGTRVALFKVIQTGILTYDIFYNSLDLVGGTAVHVKRQDILSNARELGTRSEKYKASRQTNSGPPEL
jgi:SpoVK/Ycf46/Vps4 family AAA+-type ATPase